MMKTQLKIQNIPAVVYGEASDRVWLFVHGKCGCKEEGEAFAELAVPLGWQVLAVDLPDHGQRRGSGGFDPWHAVPELRTVMGYAANSWRRVSLRANSIGAWYSMLAFGGMKLDKALFVSPVIDMVRLIGNMMLYAGVDEARLRREGEIATAFGETLSWEYLSYARDNPILRLPAPTAVLYAGKDDLTARQDIEAFCARFGCPLTVMEDGEHWFHTPHQLEVLQTWERENIGK